MATRCFGRARLGGAAARALLIFFRALDLAAALRGGDFFCVGVLAAARAAGFFLAMVLSFRFRHERLAQMRDSYVRWPKA
jgi:hypothetical protein